MPHTIEIKPGDIIFSRSRSICSIFLRMATLSQWSHTGLVIGRHNGKLTCVSTRWSGIYYNNLIDWGKHEVRIYRVKGITECQVQKMISYASSQVGKKFSLGSCVDFFVYGKAYGCMRWLNSMFIYMTMLKAGIDLKHKEKTIVTPGDLYEDPILEFVTEI